MSDLFATVRLVLMIGGGLVLAFLILLSMPQSRLRQIVQPIVGFAISALSAAYILSPVDAIPELVLGPFGLADDAVALAVGVASAVMAMATPKDPGQIH